VVTSGATVQTTAGSISYTIGQIDYLHTKANIGSLRAGIQQPFEITSVSNKDRELNVSIELFPNPTSNQLTMYIHDSFENPLIYKLYDVQGKILENANIIGHKSQISLASYSGGMYFLQVIDLKQKKLKSFRIIKNK
jgi:hypothetical protein